MTRSSQARLVTAIIATYASLASAQVALSSELRRWELVWHDEFSGSPGSPLDPTKWAYDVGNGGMNPGWGNHEWERYSNSTSNVFQDGRGHLVIRAIRVSDRLFTSGRIKTQGLFSFMYGRVEASIKIPYAQGIWPAFWMLGNTFPKAPWPKSGEIDIMENFGPQHGDGGTNHGTLHGPGYGGTGLTAEYHLPSGKLSDDFHIYAIEWVKDSIEFFVDGHSYAKFIPADLRRGALWVFNNRPFFLLLNVAIGGSPAPVGYPNATTEFPQEMLVSYVRVYQQRN